jgi:hypothetical protein
MGKPSNAAAAQAALAAASLTRIYSPADLATINALRTASSPIAQYVPQQNLLIRAQNGTLINPNGMQFATAASSPTVQTLNHTALLNLQQQQQQHQQRFRPSMIQQAQNQIHQQQQQQQQNLINLQNQLASLVNQGQNANLAIQNQANLQQQNQNNIFLAAAIQQQQHQQQQQMSRIQTNPTLSSGFA